jgi:hypothetical protein
LQSFLKQPPAAATPTRHTLPNINPSTTKPYQTLGPSSTVQHLWYPRTVVLPLPPSRVPCGLVSQEARPSTLLLYRSRCSEIIATTCQHIRHLQRTLPPPYRKSSLPVALVRGDITCPGVCTCAGYTTAADRGANAERLSATPSWRSPRSRQDKTLRTCNYCNGHAARGTRIVFGFRRKRCSSISSLHHYCYRSPSAYFLFVNQLRPGDLHT